MEVECIASMPSLFVMLCKKILIMLIVDHILIYMKKSFINDWRDTILGIGNLSHAGIAIRQNPVSSLSWKQHTRGQHSWSFEHFRTGNSSGSGSWGHSLGMKPNKAVIKWSTISMYFNYDLWNFYFWSITWLTYGHVLY